jgi:hypothetical protein
LKPERSLGRARSQTSQVSNCDFENLLQAYRRARKGKKQTPEMYAFHFNLEEDLWDLHRELQEGAYQPGPYRNFFTWY